MKNVIVIKGADFSNDKVETVQLVDELNYNYIDYLYKDKKWWINAQGTSPMTHGNAINTIFGGFIDVSQYRGKNISIKNGADSPRGSWYYFIKSVDFTSGAFTPCDGEDINGISVGVTVNRTIPSDADYMYIVYTRDNVILNTSVDILVPRQQ